MKAIEVEVVWPLHRAHYLDAALCDPELFLRQDEEAMHADPDPTPPAVDTPEIAPSRKHEKRNATGRFAPTTSNGKRTAKGRPKEPAYLNFTGLTVQQLEAERQHHQRIADAYSQLLAALGTHAIQG